MLVSRRLTHLNGMTRTVLFFFALNLPATLFGQELTFVPTFESFHGDLDLVMMSQTTENRQGIQVTNASDRIFSEKINLSADGFVYHPRFAIFKAGLSEGLNQEREVGGPGNGSRSGSAMDYELRTTLLPEHPYTLDLFVQHTEFSNRAMTFMQGQASTLDEKGAAFTYRGRPFSFSSGYSENKTQSVDNQVDSRSYHAQAGYVTPLMANLANYSHSESSSSSGVHSSHLQYGYSNAFRYADIAFDSRINNTDTAQTRFLAPGLETHTLMWTEQLTAPLPGNLLGAASFAYQDENDRTAADGTNPAHEEFNRSSSTAFNLTHRLYQSLVTNLSVNDLSARSVSGEITTSSETLGSTYTKIIPTGLLTAAVSFGEMSTERLGTPSILDEVQRFALTVQFPLAQQHVLDSTIVVKVKDPLTGVLITLPPTDYSIAHSGNSVLITVVSVFPMTPLPDPLAVYEFHINYSLSQQSRVNATSQGYSIRVDFLHNLLSAYYSYFASNQQMPSGPYAGGADKTESETIGLSCRIDQYSGMLERLTFRSSTNPYESWKGMAQYLSPISDRTNVFADISYLRTEFFPSASVPIGSAYLQKVFGVNVRMDMKFPAQKLNFFATGSYAITRSLVDSEMLALNSFLTWRIGLIFLDTGMQISRSASKGGSNVKNGTETNALLSQYYYMTLRRSLF
jgi:hypothetical protein